MREIETLPERVNDANPPDHRANAPAWIAFSLGLAALLVVGLTFVGLFGLPDQTGGGSSGAQQQASTAPANPKANRETTGSSGSGSDAQKNAAPAQQPAQAPAKAPATPAPAKP